MLKYLNPWYWIRTRSQERVAEIQRQYAEARAAEEARLKYYAEQTQKMHDLRAKRTAKSVGSLTAQNAVALDKKGTPKIVSSKSSYVNDYAANSDGADIAMNAIQIAIISSASASSVSAEAVHGGGGSFDGGGATGDWQSDSGASSSSASSSSSSSSSTSSSSSSSDSGSSSSSSGGGSSD